MKILFFSPFARVIQHSIPEATLARELERLGHDVEVIACGKAFRGQCTTLSAMGRSRVTEPEFIERTCKECQACSKKLFKSRSELDSLYRRFLERTGSPDAAQMIEGVNTENFASFSHDGIPFGRISSYQHMIELKKLSSKIEPHEWPLFRDELEHCFITYFALKEWCFTAREQPAYVLIYNSLYSVNAIARRFFENQGVTVISLHAGTNLHYFHDSLLLAKGDTVAHFMMLKSHWKNFSSAKLSLKDSSWVYDHIKEVTSGKSVFAYSTASAGNDTFLSHRWGIPSDGKIVLVAMSSHDERFAAEYVGAMPKPKDSIFETQIEWLIAMVEFASMHPDIYVVVRLHPREFPNKRESVVSQHAKEILEILKEAPRNVIVNTPSDQISLYDLARHVDAMVTSWSSVAKELALLGIPSVFYSDDLQLFASDIGKIAQSKHEYFELIAQETRMGRRDEIREKILRWYAYETRWSTLQFTTSLSPSAPKYKKLLWRVFAKIDFSLFLGWRIGRIRNRSALKALLDGSFFEQRFENSEPASTDQQQQQIFEKIEACFWGHSEQRGNAPLPSKAFS